MHHLARLGRLDDKGYLRTLAHVYQIVVYGRQGQQRRNGGMLGIDAAVTQHDIVDTVVNSLFGHAAQLLDGRLDALGTARRIEQHGQRLSVETLVAKVAQYVEFRIRYDGARQLHHLAVLLRGVEYIAAHGTDVARYRHHELLAQGIHGRVCHLCELLPEVVEQRLRTRREYRQRRIVTHRPDRLGSITAHRKDYAVNVLTAVSEGAHLTLQIGQRVHNMPSRRYLTQDDTVLAQPLHIWMLACQRLLDLGIILYGSRLGIYHKYLARTQTTLLAHLRRLDIEYAHLRGYDHHVVLGDEISSRTQAVSVEHTARITSVREEQRRRAVPWLHEDTVILVKCLQLTRDWVLVVIALGHQHRERMRQAHAAHHEELQNIVQRSAVAHVGLHDGIYILHVAEALDVEQRLARDHPAAVALDGVDLAVVPEQTERLRQMPLGEGVGRESRVYQCQSAREIGIYQIGEVVSQLHARQHTLIDKRTRRQTHNIYLLLVVQFVRGHHRMLDLAARNIYTFLERLQIRCRGTSRIAYEYLLYGRLRRPRRISQNITVDGDVAHVCQRQALGFDLVTYNTERQLLLLPVFRHEHHTRGITSLLGDGNTLQENELVRYLHHDAGTVTSLVVGTLGPAVRHVLENLKGIFNHLVRFAPVDMRHKSDTAPVLLVVRIIKALRLRSPMVRSDILCHGYSVL